MMESFLHSEKKLPFIFMLSCVFRLLKMRNTLVKRHKNRTQIL